MRNYLGEFEELVMLTVTVLADDAYGVSIRNEMQKRTGNTPSIGALHTALNRLEKKGYLRSSEGGATAERGGRRKRYFQLTSFGKQALAQARDLRESYWQDFPTFSLD